MTPPAGFADTANAIARKAFVIKDSVLWVDDFHPTNDPIERNRMDGTAQRLARAYGHGTARGRLPSDCRMQPLCSPCSSRSP